MIHCTVDSTGSNNVIDILVPLLLSFYNILSGSMQTSLCFIVREVGTTDHKYRVQGPLYMSSFNDSDFYLNFDLG